MSRLPFTGWPVRMSSVWCTLTWPDTFCSSHAEDGRMDCSKIWRSFVSTVSLCATDTDLNNACVSQAVQCNGLCAKLLFVLPVGKQEISEEREGESGSPVCAAGGVERAGVLARTASGSVPCATAKRISSNGSAKTPA